MPRRIGFIAAWVMVTLVAVAIAAQAVGSVRDQVTNRPSPIVDVSALATTATTAAVEPTSTLAPTTSPTTAPDTTTTSTTSTTVVEPSTTTTTIAPTVTTTTAAPPPTTTTTAPAEWKTETYELVGGWVRIRYGGGEVFLDGAGANAGFTMDVEDNGPDEVEVRFRSERHKSEFAADFEDGKLRVSTEEEGDDEDEGDD